jgi:hypothetical protein
MSLAVAIAHTLGEGHGSIPDAAVTTIVGMEIFEMLARIERAVIKSGEARRSVVSNLVLKDMVRLGFGGGVSEPGAQAVVNGDFTFSTMSFSILEHLVKTAGGLRAL